MAVVIFEPMKTLAKTLQADLLSQGLDVRVKQIGEELHVFLRYAKDLPKLMEEYQSAKIVPRVAG